MTTHIKKSQRIKVLKDVPKKSDVG